MSKLGTNTDLESVLTNRAVMFRFRIFLASIFSVENLTFWLEAEIYKYLPEEQLVPKAKLIYQVYFSGSPEGTPINLDDMSQELELKKRMAAPARDTFVSVQGIVWGLLKFECFARFKLSPTYNTKPTKQEELQLKDDYTIQLLDQFLAIRKDQKKGKTKSPKMPSKEKELNLEDNLYDQPDIEEIFDDMELMLAFREYLYQTHIQENLVFWLETELYRRIDDSEERAQRAQEIIDKFCKNDSPYIINCDESLLNKMIASAKKPTPSTFRAAQKMTWRGLKNEWFPQFCVSDLYKAFDKQDLKYSRSSPTRQRANTIDYYEQIVSLKKRLESAGRDFVAEIVVDDALSPLPSPPRVAPTRVVPVPIKAPEVKAESSSSHQKSTSTSGKVKRSTSPESADSSSAESALSTQSTTSSTKKDKKDKKDKDKDKKRTTMEKTSSEDDGETSRSKSPASSSSHKTSNKSKDSEDSADSTPTISKKSSKH